MRRGDRKPDAQCQLLQVTRAKVVSAVTARVDDSVEPGLLIWEYSDAVTQGSVCGDAPARAPRQAATIGRERAQHDARSEAGADVLPPVPDAVRALPYTVRRVCAERLESARRDVSQIF
jgi:hypothetical protein